MMCGGITNDTKEADAEVKGVCDQVKEELKGKIGNTEEKFELTPLKYKTQLVAGTNFFIKARIGDGKYIHIRVYRPLPCSESQSLQLHSYQEGKTVEDEIEFFE